MAIPETTPARSEFYTMRFYQPMQNFSICGIGALIFSGWKLLSARNGPAPCHTFEDFLPYHLPER